MPYDKNHKTLDVKEINAALEEGRLLIRPHWSPDNSKFYTHISDCVYNDDHVPTYRLGEWFDNDFMIWGHYMTVEEIRTQNDFFELTKSFFE